jgi:hypothetical protein
MKKFDPKVFRLGYVALATADIERTKEHYLEAIGLTQTAKGDDGAVLTSTTSYSVQPARRRCVTSVFSSVPVLPLRSLPRR